MSDTQQRWATLSRNFVAQQSRLVNCQFSIGKQAPNMVSSDTDDNIISSKLSALLIASTLYQRRRMNIRKRT